MEINTNNRINYLDYLRVVATFAIVLIHVAGFHWYSISVNEFDWKVLNFYDSIARWGVPIFLMVSGSLFLNKKIITIKEMYKKYILRLFIIYIFWCLFYFLVDGNSILDQFLTLFSENYTEAWVKLINNKYHLWFMPMIIGIYICIPFLKEIVKNKTVAYYFLFISFLFWFLFPQMFALSEDFLQNKKLCLIFKSLKGCIDKTELKFVMNYTFYFVLGYILSNTYVQKKYRIGIYILGLVGCIFTIYADLILSIRSQTPIDKYYAYTCINVLLQAVAVFVFFKHTTFSNLKTNTYIEQISKCCLGAYLFHLFLIEELYCYGIDVLSFSNTVFSTPIITLIVFFISLGFTAIIKQIPRINKYIV